MRVVVTVAFAVATAGTVQTGQGILEEIVVSVNGEPITRTEIDERLRVTREATGTREADPGLLTRVLRDAVDERLMTQRAADLRLDVSEQDVDRILANVQAESHVESDAAFDELLRAEGMSRAKLRAATRRQLLISQVRELASGNLTVSNDEALKYFTAHRQDLSMPAGVTFREIQIAVPQPGAVPDRERDRAIVKVVAAGDRLAQGTAFETVARELSESASRESGGLVGPVDAASLEPSIRTALEALRPGAVSPPLETTAGYGFLKLEDSRPAAAPTFHENREKILDVLLLEKQRVAVEALLTRLRFSAILEWKRRDLQAAYERPPYR